MSSSCTEPAENSVETLAREYVLLSLHLNTHDDGYVDAYYGDASWREEVEASPEPLGRIRERAESLLEALDTRAGGVASDGKFSRIRYLQRHVASMLARLDILEGKELSFDAEAQLLYDSRPPHYDTSRFDSVLTRIDALIGGSGSLTDRVETFRDQFVVPEDRLDAVFRAAMSECRDRTRKFIALPDSEEFTVEYVTDKPWGAYNWFQGDAVSLIQVNTDSPTRIDSAVHLACHEGYPGHHVFNILREKRYREEGLVEFSLQPLYAPIAPIAEGSANYGKKVAFPDDERIRYEREVLFPIAGLDATAADRYYQLLELMSLLAPARNEAARKYLSGEWDAEATAKWLMKYQLTSEDRARRSVRFIDTYRAYVLNYNYGEELVRRYIEDGASTQPEAWALFQELLAAPVVPSDLY